MKYFLGPSLPLPTFTTNIYRMRILFLILITGVIHTNAQIVQVVDYNTHKPLEYVAVYNSSETLSLLSNTDGRVDLSIFSPEDIIIFQHPAYQEFSIQKNAVNGEIIPLMEKVLQIKNVVVSANKWEQESSEIPNEIVSISANEIAFNNPQTSADMLAQTGQVYLQKSQFGGGSPKLRGFAANSVLMVIDGVRMNNAIYRAGNLQNIINIDPNILEGAEVVLGPGSVIYGSDALGGVMDFHSKDPKFSIDDKLRTHGNALLRYSSASNERTAHTDFGIGGKQLSWLSSWSYSKFGDLKTGKNRSDEYPGFGKKTFLVTKDFNGNDIVIPNPHPNTQSPSGFEAWNIVQKIGFKPSPSLAFTYNFYLSNTSDVPRNDRLAEVDDMGIPNDAEWYYGPQRWIMQSFKTTITQPTTLFDQAKAIIAYQDYEESRVDRGFGDDRLRTRMEEVDVWSINLDFDKQLEHGNLFYGFEYLYNDVESSAIRVNQITGDVSFPDSRYPDAGSEYFGYAFYASHVWNISDQWSLSSGARYTWIKLKAAYSDAGTLTFPFDEFELDNNALNGSLGLVFRPSSNVKANVALSSGFRSPNIDDVGKVFDFSDGEVQVPNATLEPEYTYNTEAGLEIKLSDRVEIGGTVFYTWLDQAIVRDDFLFNGADSIIFDGTLSKVVALQNSGEAYVYGYSLELEAYLNSYWALDLSLTNTIGKDVTHDQPLRHATPLFGKASILYQKEKLRAEFYTDFNGNHYRDDIPDSEIVDKPILYARHRSDRSKDGSPGWYTLNLKASYQITPNFTLNTGVENILDKHYRTYSSGISAPGRNVIVSLRATF